MIRTVVIVLTLAVGGIATAQPAPGAPAEPPPPPPEPVADPEPMIPAPVAMPESDGPRPSGYAVGIGLGYDLPADLQTPNTTSVRFRLASGLTFEPSVTAGRSKFSQDSGMNNTTNKDLELTVGALARIPLRTRGRVDFELLGAASVSIVSDIPSGADNDTKTTAFAIAWGIGLGYWISPHWEVSMSALNPLFLYSVRTVHMGPTMETETTSMTTAAIFDPNVIMMLHLFW